MKQVMPLYSCANTNYSDSFGSFKFQVTERVFLDLRIPWKINCTSKLEHFQSKILNRYYRLSPKSFIVKLLKTTTNDVLSEKRNNCSSKITPADA